jgi:hypothetical protein
VSPWDKRERATAWYQQWIEPVTTALYVRQLTQARDNLYAARTAIARGAVTPVEAAEKASVLLDYMEYHIAKVVDPVGALDDCGEYEERLQLQSSIPTVNGLRAKLLLQFRCSAERIGYREFEVREFEDLYDAVPVNDRNDEFWHFVSTWAFTHFHTSILERAYEEYSVNRGSFMTDWLWWRVKLMYLLSANRAVEEDVAHLLNNLSITEHIRDFDHTFKPALVRAELWTPLIVELFELRRIAVEETTVEDIKRAVAE